MADPDFVPSLDPFDPDAVPKAAGSFVDLAHGRVYYEHHEAPAGEGDGGEGDGGEGDGGEGDGGEAAAGGEGRPLVICCHGISWWSFVYNDAVDPLMDRGFDVLLFDFYGRGRSDAAASQVHDNWLFVDQINDLLEALGMETRKFTLVGYSMGGAVAISYASAFGERLDKLVLLAPAGTPVPMPGIVSVLKIPWLGGALFRWMGPKQLNEDLEKRRFCNDFVDNTRNPELVEALMDRIRWCINDKEGWIDAFHSTITQFPLSDLSECYEAVGALQGDEAFPVELIWGDLDIMVPYRNSELVAGWIPRANLTTIHGSGHALPYDEPAAFLEAFVRAVAGQ